jgi:glycosyltransferase involved in cell wall biosynthesis
VRPYASIIVPTHDRAETLPIALRSALSQTVPDIEVLVVGDGCTSAVRDVVRALGDEDSRIRFFDLPKSSHHGAASRHHAIVEARSDRIFYSDDDDLLLPHHVEVLGSALDEVDVIDTPVASIHVDGQAMLGVHDSGHPIMRTMLDDESFKGVFDTHLAHRRSTYLAGGGAWIPTTGRHVFYRVLKAFAADESLTWRTVPRITALSFHGMCRFGVPGTDRARELEAWEPRIADPMVEDELRASGSFAFHGIRLFDALHASGQVAVRDFLDEYLARHDVDDEQSAALHAARMLVTGELSDEVTAAEILDDLLDARLSPGFPTAQVLERYLHQFPAASVAGFLDRCRPRPSVALARFVLETRSGPASGGTVEETERAYEALPPGPRFFFGVAVMKVLHELGECRSAWGWSERLLEDTRESFHAVEYWRIRKEIAADVGRPVEAEYALRKQWGLSALLT